MINHCVTLCLLYILVIHIVVEVISRVCGRSTCVWCSYHFLLSICILHTCRDLSKLLDSSFLSLILNYILKLSVGAVVPLFLLSSVVEQQCRGHRVAVPWVEFDKSSSFVLAGLITPF